MKKIIAAALVAAICTSAASAQEKDRTVAVSDVQAAQLLINNNRLDDARRLLDHDLASQPEDSELLFLRAMVAVEEKDYDTAISLFRRILVHEPNTERVRLELARAFS
jgi:predicted Zn-dependent protease